MLIDLPNEADIAALMVHRPSGQLLVASSGGRGFRVDESDVIGQTRNGKQVLNLEDGDRGQFCIPADGDTVAVLGDNRKLLLFPWRMCRR